MRVRVEGRMIRAGKSRTLDAAIGNTNADKLLQRIETISREEWVPHRLGAGRCT